MPPNINMLVKEFEHHARDVGSSAALDCRSVDHAFILVWGVEFIDYTLDIA
jgi:hypothetical protein